MTPRKLKPPSLRAGCPFCWEWLPPAELLTKVFSSDSRGGRCPCGAVYVVDETGRLGGAALLDALALACDGDLDRAEKLDSNQDYEVKTKPLGPERFQSHSPAAPKVWAVKLTGKK
jgi:hypothetical protein